MGQQLTWETLIQAPIYYPKDIPNAEKRTLSESDADEMFEFIAKSMEIEPSRVRLVIGSESEVESFEATGLYQQRGIGSLENSDYSVITLARSLLDDPQLAVGTLAHELAHEILLGGGLLDPDDTDGEWLTDLLPVFRGYGLFLANNTIREESDSEYDTITRTGYLPSRMFGHALALLAWLQADAKPAWIDHLRLDARKPCAASLRYFRKTADALVTPEDLLTNTPEKKETSEIRQMSPTHRLAFLWDQISLKDQIKDPTAISKIVELLKDKDRVIRKSAVDCFYNIDELSEKAQELLVEVMGIDSNSECGIETILVLNHHDMVSDEAFDLLRVSLRNLDKKICDLSAYAIGELAKKNRLPNDQPRLVSAMLEVAERSLCVGLDDRAMHLRPALTQIENLSDLVRDEYSNWDAERQNALIKFVANQE